MDTRGSTAYFFKIGTLSEPIKVNPPQTMVPRLVQRGSGWCTVYLIIDATFEHSNASGAYMQSMNAFPSSSPSFQGRCRGYTSTLALYTCGASTNVGIVRSEAPVNRHSVGATFTSASRIIPLVGPEINKSRSTAPMAKY